MGNKTKIASDLFRQRWFRELEPKYKALWLYLTLESNIIGVFEMDSESWNHFCKTSGLTDTDALVKFGNRFRPLPNHPTKGIIVGKLSYQASFGQNSAQWKWVEKELASVGLTYEKLKELESRQDEPVQMEFGITKDEPEPKQAKETPQRLVIPPKVEWVEEYCRTRANGINAQEYIDWNTSKGWMVGKVRMKDWQANIRTWESRRKKDGPVPAPASSVRPAPAQPVRKMF